MLHFLICQKTKNIYINSCSILWISASAPGKPISVYYYSPPSVKMSVKIQVRNNRSFFSMQKKDVPLWCKNVQNMARFFNASDTFGMMGGGTAGAMMANLPFSIFAVFNKGFFLLSPSLLPSFWLEGPLAAPQTLTDRCPWWSRTRSAWRHKQLQGCEGS